MSAEPSAPRATAAGPRPRVVVVGPLPPPLGGVQLMNRMLVGSSLARDFEFHAVDAWKKRLRWAVDTHSPLSLFYLLRQLVHLLRALAEVRPDVVYLHAASGFSFTRDWALMAVARLTGHKVVCHYHGNLHTRFPSPRTRLGRLAGRLMMAAANRVVVLSPTYCEVFTRAWGHRGVSWSPNLVDVAFHRDPPPGSPAPWLAPGERGVLFVGRLSAPKGLFDLYDAIPRVAERHPEVRFLLCGVAESEAQEPVVRAEAERRGIARRVTFLGSLVGRDKALAYACASVFVSPSWTEAFPLVIPEAMAAGLPLVVTGVGAIPDFVHDGEDGFLVPPRDPAALADRLNRLLGDEPLRARMAARVLDRAPREFDIEVGAARVRAVLTELLAASAQRRRS